MFFIGVFEVTVMIYQALKNIDISPFLPNSLLYVQSLVYQRPSR